MLFQLYIAHMRALNFIKMNGLGNDFVILDGRDTSIQVNSAQAQAICDRTNGIGCDQLILIESTETNADIRMRIRNADGGEIEACGNATRCIGRLVMDEKGSNTATIETLGGLLIAEKVTDGIMVDMGPAYLGWRDIPLSKKMDTLSLDISEGPLANPVAVGIGNPHAIFFVSDLAQVDLAKVGPIIEFHDFYPNRTNVGAAQILSREKIRLKVWERGVGMTKACGTGACASLVAAVRRDLSERKASIVLDGGVLDIEWRTSNHVFMTGPTEIDYTGTWTL